MALPEALARAVESWASFYDAHRVVSIGVRYLHLAGLLVGGGTALATDRHVLRAARATSAAQTIGLGLLGSSHRVVVPALAAVVMSGLLLTAADTGTFLASRLYWFKMGLVALLLANGGFLVMAEKSVHHGAGSSGWARLAVASGLSAVLWLLILLVGVLLTVAA